MNFKSLIILTFSLCLSTSLWAKKKDKENKVRTAEIGEIHSAGSPYKLLPSTKSYFEIKASNETGSEAMGRVNLANNSRESVKFSLVDDEELPFQIRTIRNSIGKSFGVLTFTGEKVAKAVYKVKVAAVFENGAKDFQTYEIHRVDEYLADKFMDFAQHEFTKIVKSGTVARRLSMKVKDSVAREYFSKLNKEGFFTDLKFMINRSGWDALCEGGGRLNSLVLAYYDPQSSLFKNQELKTRFYQGILVNSKFNHQFKARWSDTHTWRNSDHLAGIALRVIADLRQEMKSSEKKDADKAMKVYDALLDVCDNLWAERMHERPAIGNANRNHRMRSLFIRAAITYDYNRALTDQDVWFDKADPRIPGFYPDGIFSDLKELLETGYVFMDKYNKRNGIFPDGTICHHPAVGIQFTADAYGWEWLVEHSVPLANFLKNTRYKTNDKVYDIIADKLLDTYRSVIFNGYIDMSVGGIIQSREKWAERMPQAVVSLIEARSDDTKIKRLDELKAFSKILKGSPFYDPLSLNQPFWNIDYLVHRRPTYFASAKMISTRSRGLERGIDRKSYYYLGDGALFIRNAGSEYNSLTKVFNWHAIPGTTAEQRGVEIPLAADSPFKGANGTNSYAGVSSNGQYGFSAFKYERNHADSKVCYATVNANKAYFFFENEILALGNNVRRVYEGQGKDIWTTLNQVEWETDIYVSGIDNALKLNSRDIEKTFKANQPFWLHQKNVGYIVIPAKTTNVLLKTQKKQGKASGVFTLAINHGKNPQGDDYKYIILPNCSRDQLQTFVTELQNGDHIAVVENSFSRFAVHHKKLKLSQIAFFEPGELTVNGMEISVDRPALVMLQDLGETYRITVTDPLHSIENTSIQLSLNKKLSGEGAAYDDSTGLTKISFTHSSVEALAGKPQTQVFHID
ncbi:MAG: polysaccharide lyase beta-sandwich domain-containing protein [Lentisphaerales bacterium]|nr:polysaccharide lyase beta-sandwich domain-containing protein [Lentisphaerales bacterium]